MGTRGGFNVYKIRYILNGEVCYEEYKYLSQVDLRLWVLKEFKGAKDIEVL